MSQKKRSLRKCKKISTKNVKVNNIVAGGGWKGKKHHKMLIADSEIKCYPTFFFPW